MADTKKSETSVSGNSATADRTKKAAATRAITQAKLENLPTNLRYAHQQVTRTSAALRELADHIIDGGQVSGEMLASIANLNGELGKCLFGIR